MTALAVSVSEVTHSTTPVSYTHLDVYKRQDLYVVNCCRTAIGSFGGSLKNTPAAEMGAVVVKEALKRANVAPELSLIHI